MLFLTMHLIINGAKFVNQEVAIVLLEDSLLYRELVSF